MSNDELTRLRKASELAIARARLAEEHQPRTRRRTSPSLVDVDDGEENSQLTMALVEGAVKGALSATEQERHRKSHSDQVEIRRGSVSVRTKWWVAAGLIVLAGGIWLLVELVRAGVIR